MANIAPPQGWIVAQDGMYEDPSTGYWMDPNTGDIFPPETQGRNQSVPSGGGGMGGIMQILNGVMGGGIGGAGRDAMTPMNGPSGIMSLFGGGSASPMGGGTMSLPMGAEMPAGFEAVGSAMDGGTMIAPTATGGGGGIMAALPYLSVPAGMYGMYDILKGDREPGRGLGEAGRNTLQGAASGAAIGVPFGPLGMGIGAVVGGVTGAVHSLTGSGKSKGQVQRDESRKAMKEAGLVDENYNITLPDGTTFNIGKEKPWEEGEKSVYGGTRQYDVDMSAIEGNQDLRDILGAADAIGRIFPGKHKEQTAGYLFNAATRSGNAADNLRSMADQIGGHDALVEYLNEMVSDETERAGYHNALNRLYGTAGHEQLSGTGSQTGTKPKPAAQPPANTNSRIPIQARTPENSTAAPATEDRTRTWKPRLLVRRDPNGSTKLNYKMLKRGA